jgi:hypothetical protein
MTNDTTGSATTDGFSLYVSTAGEAYYRAREATGTHRFYTGTDEQMQIKADGRICMGSTNVGSGSADDLNIENTADHAGMTIRCPNNKWGSIHFADGGTGDELYRAQVSYDHGNDWLRFYAGGSAGGECLRIKGNRDVTVVGGDLILGTAGKGISFINAADTASAETVNSSVLDDYEEGVHVVTDPGGNWTIGNNGAYRHMSYVKIGQMCTVTGQIYCGAGSGLIKFSLPFAAIANQTVSGNAADLGYANGAVRLYQWDIPSNAFNVTMQVTDGNSHSTLDVTLDNANSTQLDGDNGAYVSYTLTYRTAS